MMKTVSGVRVAASVLVRERVLVCARAHKPPRPPPAPAGTNKNAILFSRERQRQRGSERDREREKEKEREGGRHRAGGVEVLFGGGEQRPLDHVAPDRPPPPQRRRGVPLPAHHFSHSASTSFTQPVVQSLSH